MGKLSQTDKHDPYVHTANPNPEQPNAEEPNKPGQHIPFKKEAQLEKQEDLKKTGTR
jgi:hypothetical protein